MGNRRERRAFGSQMRRSASWGDWETIREAPVHPMAPAGLQWAVRNNHFSVQVFHHRTDWGTVVQLMVRRHDAQPVRDWTALQRIKDELFGPDRTAVEVFPPSDQLVDSANIYHLWILPHGFELPFGLHRMDRATACVAVSDRLAGGGS